MREGAPAEGRRRMCEARREGNEKEEGDERNKGQVEKSPRIFVFPFARSKNKNISRRKSRQFETKDLSLRSIKHNLSLFPSLCGVHIASNSVDYCPVDQRKCSMT